LPGCPWSSPADRLALWRGWPRILARLAAWNLRRYLGHDVQYFAAVEPQRRLAPHIHVALRGTIARSELRRVLAATYHRVWWPDVPVKYRDGDELPVWLDQVGGYVDPATGEVLPTWDEALDAISAYDLPWHVARFGGAVRRPGRARRVP
jgi:Replication initiator protein, pSAM2